MNTKKKSNGLLLKFLKYAERVLGGTRKLCSRFAGVIATYYAIVELPILLLFLIISAVIGVVIGSDYKYTQLNITSTRPDEYVLIDFPSVRFTPRTEISVYTHEGRTHRKRVTVYDVTGFVHPDGRPMNDLIGLPRRPKNTVFPVRIRDATVMAPKKKWNHCIVDFEHDGKTYKDYPYDHDESCSTLVGNRKVGRYVTSGGELKNAELPACHTVAFMVKSACMARIAFNLYKLYLLIYHGFFSSYKLPEEFESFGKVGKMYRKWWHAAFEADKQQQCWRALGDTTDAVGWNAVQDVTDVAGGLTGIYKMFKDCVSKAFLSYMVDHPKNLDDVKFPKILGLAFKNILRRVMTYFLVICVSFFFMRWYMFESVIPAAKGSSRPWWHLLAVLGATTGVVMALSRLIEAVDDSFVRDKFRKMVRTTRDSHDWINDFHRFDLARIAI